MDISLDRRPAAKEVLNQPESSATGLHPSSGHGKHLACGPHCTSNRAASRSSSPHVHLQLQASRSAEHTCTQCTSRKRGSSISRSSQHQPQQQPHHQPQPLLCSRTDSWPELTLRRLWAVKWEHKATLWHPDVDGVRLPGNKHLRGIPLELCGSGGFGGAPRQQQRAPQCYPRTYRF
jgi:hypothetical protein